MRLEGKTALVTGAASGFGLAIAGRLARDRARVALVDRDADGVDAAAQPLEALAIHADVTDGGQVRAAVARVVDELGGLDIVVNNAGASHRNRPMLEVDEAEFDRVYAVNVKSIFHMAHAAVPVMRERGGGVILNIGSTAGIRPRPGLTWYNGSKAAVHMLTKSMAVELAGDGIRVCAIAPVIGETALLETFMGVPDTPENRARFIATIPLGRMSLPGDIADAAAWLVSPEAGFVTGVVLEVDGGRCV